MIKLMKMYRHNSKGGILDLKNHFAAHIDLNFNKKFKEE
jgi:hypothetical protein